VVCGLLGFAVYNVALNAAERRIDAGIAAVLVNVGPIFIAILAGLVLREGFPRLLLAGCAVAFAGAALIGRRSARCRRCSPCRAGSSAWPGWRWPVDQLGRPSSLAEMPGHRRLIRPAPSDPAPC